MCTKLQLQKLKQQDNLGGLGIYGRILPKQILETNMLRCGLDVTVKRLWSSGV
jgi:hypothetical protein